MPRAFIVQDDGTKNLSLVHHYCDSVVPVATKNFPMFTDGQIRIHIEHMKHQLRDFDPGEDYVLAIGDPINIGIVTHFVMQKGGGRFLKWDKQSRNYNVIDLRKERF